MANFSRKCAKYEMSAERFVLKERVFSRQYAHVYAERLWTMRPKLTSAARCKWGNDVDIRKLHELQSGERCVIIGTLFKHMDLKPNILREISDEHNLVPQPERGKYTDEYDKLILEDDLQRIVIVGNIDVQAAVTGCIVALLGEEPVHDKGKFHVEEYCFQIMPSQRQIELPDEDKYVLFVSGMNLGRSDDNFMQLQMMVDMVTGHLGEEDGQDDFSKVVRVIVAGNSLSKDTMDKESMSKAKYLSKKSSANSVEAVKVLDDILVQLAACVEVDLMPGEFDPANHVLPQQAMHHCMFPQAFTYQTIHAVTNPYSCEIDGVQVLGTSGQPVDDVYKFSSMDNRLEILEMTLKAGHIAPTAPDTLGCYPYKDQDPFMLNTCPDVYFAANQPKFQQKFYKGPKGQNVLLLTIPSFSDTSTCVLLNIRNLKCRPIKFEVGLLDVGKEIPEVIDK